MTQANIPAHSVQSGKFELYEYLGGPMCAMAFVEADVKSNNVIFQIVYHLIPLLLHNSLTKQQFCTTVDSGGKIS